jgi:hypothetical protein
MRIFADVAPVSKDSFFGASEMVDSSRKETAEGDLVFCRWFRHPVTGKRIYPRNGKVFVFRKKPKA